MDFIPASERWATPRDIFGMWAGASVQIEYFIYGCILMSVFRFTFIQALALIIIGNLSYFLLGICSLQGPQTGTTVFAINRASYGPNGSRPISFFNWVTQIGFEVEGLILIVGAGLVLITKAGFSFGDPAKVILVLVAVLIQGILPFLGHATIVKSLRLLIVPFVILFAVLLGFAIPHAHLHGAHSADWVWLTGIPPMVWGLVVFGLVTVPPLMPGTWTGWGPCTTRSRGAGCWSRRARRSRPRSRASARQAWRAGAFH